MGLVTLIVAVILTATGTGTDLPLEGVDLFLENVAGVETFFFKTSVFIWVLLLAMLYLGWRSRSKIKAKLARAFNWIWSFSDTNGVAGTALSVLLTGLYGFGLLFIGITVVGILLFPVFAGVSAWLAQQMAATWEPNGPSAGFVLYAILWLLLIGT